MSCFGRNSQFCTHTLTTIDVVDMWYFDNWALDYVRNSPVVPNLWKFTTAAIKKVYSHCILSCTSRNHILPHDADRNVECSSKRSAGSVKNPFVRPSSHFHHIYTSVASYHIWPSCFSQQSYCTFLSSPFLPRHRLCSLNELGKLSVVNATGYEMKYQVRLPTGIRIIFA